MSNVKTLTTIAIAAFFTVPAFAQDAQPEVVFDPISDPVAADFAAADLDQDGSLNADEFVSFAVMRAEDGDEAFRDVVMGGEYNVTFKSHDADASGGIEPSELAVHTDDTPEIKEPEIQEMIDSEL